MGFGSVLSLDIQYGHAMPPPKKSELNGSIANIPATPFWGMLFQSV